MKALSGRAVVVMWAPGDFWRLGVCTEVEMQQFWEEEYLSEISMFGSCFYNHFSYIIYIYICTHVHIYFRGNLDTKVASWFHQKWCWRMGKPSSSWPKSAVGVPLPQLPDVDSLGCELHGRHGGFPKVGLPGYPPVIIHVFIGFFIASYWGTPMTMETPMTLERLMLVN